MFRATLPFAAVAVLALAGCSSQIQAPTPPGVCYHLAAMVDGKPKFNVLASNVPDMEHCAAQLEAMRVRFLSLGGTHQDVIGAYQGNFLFLGDDGVFTAETYAGPRYPFLVRNGDQLVPVGSAP
jgi:outer membrane murein-binding lipoprotein Lpp